MRLTGTQYFLALWILSGHFLAFSVAAHGQTLRFEDFGQEMMLSFQSRGLDACANPSRSLTKAAHLGNAIAQFRLGFVIEQGIGVSVDRATARGWYRKAAESGHPSAQYRLGSIYFGAIGVPRNWKKAKSYFESAASNLHPGALFRLNSIYDRGLGVKKDVMRASRYYALYAAASRLLSYSGDPNFVDPSAEITKELGRRGKPESVAKTRVLNAGPPELLRAWRQGAAMGDPLSMLNVVQLLPGDERWQRRRYERAISALKSRAACGDAHASYRLGALYQDDFYVRKNKWHAARWFERASRRKHPAATFELGKMRAANPSTRELGLKLLLQAANWGEHRAMESLAMEYGAGAGDIYGLGKAETHFWNVLSARYDPLASPGDNEAALKRAKKALIKPLFRFVRVRVDDWLKAAPR